MRLQRRGRLARWAFAIVGAMIVFCSAVSAYADNGGIDPPVGRVPLAVGSPDPSWDPTPTPTPAPASSGAATPAPTESPVSTDPKKWKFTKSPIGTLIDTLVTQKIIKVFEQFMDSSVQAGQALFLSVAGLSFAIAAGRWGRSRIPLEELVAAIYERIVQLTIIYMLIGATFRAPGGGPGWFFLIFNTLIGMAGKAAGVDLSALVTTVDNVQLNISPGAIFDIFWNLCGYLLAATTNGQNALTIVFGLLNGATLLWFGTFLFVLVSCVFLLCAGAYIAFRFLLQLMKTYLIGCQAYLQGLLGNEMFSSMGSGIINAAFNLGIETGVFVILVGLFKPIVENFAAWMGLASVIGLVGSVPEVGMAFVAADGAIRILALLVLDVMVGLWLYALHTIPEQAAAAITGKIDVRPKEVMQTTVGNMASTRIAGAVVAGGASLAAGAAMGSVGAAQMGAGSAGSTIGAAAKGALGGYLFGGPAGAVAGAFQGVSAQKSQPEGTVAGGGGSDGAGGSSGGAGGFPFFGNRHFDAGKGSGKGAAGDAADAGAEAAAESGVGAAGKAGGKNANQSGDAAKVTREKPRAEAAGGGGAGDVPAADAPDVAAPRRPGATVREEADPIRVDAADTAVSHGGGGSAAAATSGDASGPSPNTGGAQKGSGGGQAGSQGSGGAPSGGGGTGESPMGSPNNMMMYRALTRFAQRKPRPEIPQSDGPSASVNVGSLNPRS